ncbi:MAG: carboxylating nicotinate-nucleotide diphosphorylase [candidate division Zixibacteria bacterium]|nr:carboxylating nicotinate-nucleotide diphosphorylase [candidate division Zixibacteria bacterium]
MPLKQQELITLVKAALAEDIGRGDMTSLSCLEPFSVKAEIIAKSEGILSGLNPALLAFHIVDSANNVTLFKRDGGSFKPGDIIAKIDGFNQTVFASERVALNFIGHLSGVATLTNKFVKKVEQAGYSGCKIIDTRKTLPGLRALQKQAVVDGGGVNHRQGLYDMILIKDNHIAACGSISKAIELLNENIETPEFHLQFDLHKDEIEIEVEISNEEQLREAIDCGVKRLLLDNQSVDKLTNLTRLARSLSDDLKLEASGNVSLENVADIAATGVDYISVGALTHSAPSADFSLNVTDPK